MSHTQHILGFTSLKEFGTSLFLINKSTSIVAVIAAMTTFISNYIYDSPGAVYFMMFLIMIDFITGCWWAIKENVFQSRKFQRILAPIILYPLILAISWNMAKHSDIYTILPSIVYAIFIGTLATSIFENLVKLELISAEIILLIKEKIMNSIKTKPSDDNSGTN